MHSNIVIKARNYIKTLLSGLESKGYKFHNINHTLDVFQRASYLGKQEGLDEEMQEILELAALFHDTGFIKQYDKNEPIGAKIAEEWLKKQNYPEDKIDIVKTTILSTDPSYLEPTNILEKIIKDADLDNIGRDDFWNNFHNIHEEVNTVKRTGITYNSFLLNVGSFLGIHNFFTNTQNKERNNKWQENKKELLEKIKALKD